MSFKPTIVVLILAGLGVAAVFYVEQQEAPAGAVVEAHTFLAAEQLPVDEVERITLRRGHDDELVFERTERGWMQVAPFPYPMDPYSIRQLAVLARDLQSDDAMPQSALRRGESLAALGLDPPDGVVRFDWAEGSVELHLGRRGVAGRAYVLVAGEETIQVVNQDLHDRAMDMDPKEWRDRAIFAGVGVDAEKIQRVDGGHELELVRERKRWVMTAPASTRLDPLARDEFFQALGRARCEGFIADQPEDLARYGLAEPVASLTVVTATPVEVDERVVHDRSTQKLLVGSPIGVGSEERFGMVEGRPVVVRLGGPVLRALFAPASQLADPTGSGVDPADVKSLLITGPEGELMLTRDLERWVAPGYDGVPVPRELAEELLQQLTMLRGERVEIADYPYDDELAYVTMHGFDGTPIDTVRIVRNPDTDAWAFENGDGVLRIFPSTLRLRLTPAEFGLE